MQSEVHIVGHCNSTLANLVDTLGTAWKQLERITVVSNIPVDDDTPWLPHDSYGLEVIECMIDEWDGKFQSLIMGTYKPRTKRLVYEAFNRQHGLLFSDYACLFHPTSAVSRQAGFGGGVFLAPGTVVSPYASIGDMVTVNRNSSVGHHTVIGAFSSINPGCAVAGHCRIGENVTLGIGSVVLDSLEVGRNSFIGAGSVVTRSIPENVVAWGSPARVIREREPREPAR